MMELSEFKAEMFEGAVGSIFHIAGQPVTLKEVSKMDPHAPKLRAPFVLTFTSEEPIGIDDGQQVFKHPELGEFQLLVHRVADPEGPTYEIIFG